MLLVSVESCPKKIVFAVVFSLYVFTGFLSELWRGIVHAQLLLLHNIVGILFESTAKNVMTRK